MDHVIIDDLEGRSSTSSAPTASAFSRWHTGTWSPNAAYSKDDERDLILRGYVAFLDPPKDTARSAIAALQEDGVAVKVLTGDNELVSRKICREVGIATDHVLLGSQVEGMSDAELAEAAEQGDPVRPAVPGPQAARHQALQGAGHVVGFLGDGINDAPALRAADVGISRGHGGRHRQGIGGLHPAGERPAGAGGGGAREGRKVFANILKYIRMGASSNFGNMFSVLGASIFLPFVPMAPLQILTNNLLYDFSQVPIPTDDVDPEQIAKPRPWSMNAIARFILFIGPCSSVFDYTTFFIMLYVFGCWDPARRRRCSRPAGSSSRSADADPDHPRHPHEPDPVPAEPGELAADRDDRGRSCPRVLVARSRRWAGISASPRCRRSTGPSSR